MRFLSVVHDALFQLPFVAPSDVIPVRHASATGVCVGIGTGVSPGTVVGVGTGVGLEASASSAATLLAKADTLLFRVDMLLSSVEISPCRVATRVSSALILFRTSTGTVGAGVAVGTGV